MGRSAYACEHCSAVRCTLLRKQVAQETGCRMGALEAFK